MFCSECGSKLDPNNHCRNPYCNNSENRREAYLLANGSSYETLSSTSTLETLNSKDNISLKESEMLNYFVNNEDYYFDKWAQYELNNNFISWNTAACLLNFFWLLHRKMYSLALLYSVIETLLLVFLGDLAYLFIPILMVSLGLFGNQLYIKSTLKNIDSIKRTYRDVDNNELKYLLNHKGGTTYIVPILVFIILLFVTVINILMLIAN